MVSATVDFHPPFPVLRKHFHLRSGSPQHTFSSCQDNDTPARASFFHICTLLCSAKHRTAEACVYLNAVKGALVSNA